MPRAKTESAPPGTAASISPRAQEPPTTEARPDSHHHEDCLVLAQLSPPPGANGLVDPRLHSAYEALKKSDAEGVGKITPVEFWTAFTSMLDAAEDKVELDALRPVGHRKGTDTPWERTAFTALCEPLSSRRRGLAPVCTLPYPLARVAGNHDKDGDGFLDRTELWAALNHIPLNIATLKPKEGSTAEVMHIYEGIVSSDEDKNGSIDGHELLRVMASLRQTKRTTAWLAKLLGLAGVLILVLIGAFTGVSIAVANAFKDAYANHSPTASTTLLTDGSSRPIGTAEAMVSLPMYAAPALPFEDLAQVKRLQLSYGSAEPNTKEMATVTSVRQTSATSVVFELGCSRSVRIANGTVRRSTPCAPRRPPHALRSRPTQCRRAAHTRMLLTAAWAGAAAQAHLVDDVLSTVTPICAANVSCSAFTARQEVVEATLAKADADLAAMGVTRPADRRQLAHVDGCAADFAFDSVRIATNKKGRNSILIAQQTGISLHECRQLCANSDECVAVSYKWLGTNKCRLLEATSPLQGGVTGFGWATHVVAATFESCGTNERVLEHACEPCPAGTTNAAGDHTSGADTTCDAVTCVADNHVVAHACEPCPAGTSNAAGDDASGADTTCDAVTCDADEHVVAHACEPCPTGTTNAAGDDASGDDTACECAANYHVQANYCVACPAGTTNDPGDDASGDDTACDAVTCAADQRVEAHACVPCNDGAFRASGDDPSGEDTACFEAVTSGSCGTDQVITSVAECMDALDAANIGWSEQYAPGVRSHDSGNWPAGCSYWVYSSGMSAEFVMWSSIDCSSSKVCLCRNQPSPPPSTTVRSYVLLSSGSCENNAAGPVESKEEGEVARAELGLPVAGESYYLYTEPYYPPGCSFWNFHENLAFNQVTSGHSCNPGSSTWQCICLAMSPSPPSPPSPPEMPPPPPSPPSPPFSPPSSPPCPPPPSPPPGNFMQVTSGSCGTDQVITSVAECMDALAAFNIGWSEQSPPGVRSHDSGNWPAGCSYYIYSSGVSAEFVMSLTSSVDCSSSKVCLCRYQPSPPPSTTVRSYVLLSSGSCENNAAGPVESKEECEVARAELGLPVAGEGYFLYTEPYYPPGCSFWPYHDNLAFNQATSDASCHSSKKCICLAA